MLAAELRPRNWYQRAELNRPLTAYRAAILPLDDAGNGGERLSRTAHPIGRRGYSPLAAPPRLTLLPPMTGAPWSDRTTVASLPKTFPAIERMGLAERPAFETETRGLDPVSNCFRGSKPGEHRMKQALRGNGV